MGRELQPPQPLGAQPRRQPREHRADMPALEHLLQRPEAVAAGNQTAARVDDQQLFDVESERGQRPGRQLGGWIEQHHEPAGLLRGHEAQGQQADLADAGMRQQQLGERTARPAATGELRIELRKPAGHRRLGMPAQLVPEPERRVQRLGRQESSGHSVHLKTVRSYSSRRKRNRNPSPCLHQSVSCLCQVIGEESAP